MTIVPITVREAQAFVALYHRHLPPARGAKFCLGLRLIKDARTVGVIMIGRPVARAFDDGLTAEVNRLATNGYPNACSKLYRAAWRACAAMGYRRLITYTLPQEGGSSLRAAGFKLVGTSPGGQWDTPSRPRDPTACPQQKHLWELAA
jgi:hypothetical protein